jgi:hypothetical protein
LRFVSFHPISASELIEGNDAAKSTLKHGGISRKNRLKKYAEIEVKKTGEKALKNRCNERCFVSTNPL